MEELEVCVADIRRRNNSQSTLFRCRKNRRLALDTIFMMHESRDDDNGSTKPNYPNSSDERSAVKIDIIPGPVVSQITNFP